MIYPTGLDNNLFIIYKKKLFARGKTTQENIQLVKEQRYACWKDIRIKFSNVIHC